MRAAWVSGLGVVMAIAGAVRADGKRAATDDDARDEDASPPAIVAPFVTGDEFHLHTVVGAFGPAKDTMIVEYVDLMGAGQFKGYALVADAKAPHGQRKLPLPTLPHDTLSGQAQFALIANLDKDAANELVIEFRVAKAVASPEGGYSYGTFEYVVLDWDGHAFVRLRALEAKLAKKMAARDEELRANALAPADIRAALGLTP